MPDPKWRESYPPDKVAEWLIPTAGAAASMEVRCYGFDYYSMPAQPIWKLGTLVRLSRGLGVAICDLLDGIK